MPVNMVIPGIPNETRQAQSVVEKILGESILGIYLFGSAVVGGLKSNSDVDSMAMAIQQH